MAHLRVRSLGAGRPRGLLALWSPIIQSSSPGFLIWCRQFCMRMGEEDANLGDGVQTVLLLPHAIDPHKAKFKGWGNRLHQLIGEATKYL